MGAGRKEDTRGWREEEKKGKRTRQEKVVEERNRKGGLVAKR